MRFSQSLEVKGSLVGETYWLDAVRGASNPRVGYTAFESDSENGGKRPYEHNDCQGLAPPAVCDVGCDPYYIAGAGCFREKAQECRAARKRIDPIDGLIRKYWTLVKMDDQRK